MSELLEIAVLGGLRIRRGAVPVQDLGLRKAEALFVYLACTRQPHTREELADLLWDERAPAQALASLRTLLTKLRPSLESHLLITRSTVAFNTAAPYWLDIAALEERLERAYAARAPNGGWPAPAVDELEGATALYTGAFLQGFSVRESSGFEEWMLHEQQRLERRVLAALRDLVSVALAQHDYRLGVTQATRLLEIDPLDEDGHRQLMELLARSGQRHLALQQYAACERVLDTELGVTPGAPTTALVQRIRAGELDPSPATSTAAPQGPRPAHLPVQLTPFVGRGAELAALQTLLTARACRLVTVAGLGGSGKTRLAIEVAPLLPGYRDGLYFVPLGAVQEPAFLVSAIADALGYVFAGAQDAQTQLLAYLQEKELLLVLDGFEHLLDAADMLIAILRAAPGVTLLVTSREPLQLAAEQIFDLAGLAVPPAGAPEPVDSYPAVQLFVQRAQRVQPQFTLGSAVAPWVVQICRLVEGLPLGIELAAGWVRGQSCQAIAQQLAHNLDVLATSQRDVPARHRSLRAVFDQSWQRLTAEEQAAFRRLAVFHGGFDDDAARAVASGGTPWAHAVLPALVQQSLLRHSPLGRYELHELLRQYAWEKLQQAPDEVRATWERHAAHYLAVAEAAAGCLQGPEQRAWLLRLENEHDNLRAALRWVLANGAGATALRLGAALGGFWLVHGHLSEGRGWLTAALAANDADAGPAYAVAGYWAGVLARQQGDFAEALDRLTESRDRARARDDEWGVGRSLAALGEVYRVQGNSAQARALLEDGLALARAARDPETTADALISLGLLAFEQGDYATARTQYDEALARQREMGNNPAIAATLLHLGNVAYYQGDYPPARTLYAEALGLGREVGDKQGIAMALHNLGMLAQESGDYAAARTYLEEDMTLFREMGHKPGIAHSLFTLGRGAYAQGDYAAARRYQEESLTLWREVGNPLGEAFALAERGLVALQGHDLPLARQSLSASLRLCHEQQNKYRVALCLLGLAAVVAAGGSGAAGAAQPSATRLIGAAESLLSSIGGMLEPAYRRLYEQTAREMRSRLGDVVFAQERAAGRALDWEAAVAQALAEES